MITLTIKFIRYILSFFARQPDRISEKWLEENTEYWVNRR